MTVELNFGRGRWAEEHSFLKESASQPDRVLSIPLKGELPPIPFQSKFLEYQLANVYKSWIGVRSGDQDIKLATIEFPVEADWASSFETEMRVMMVWVESRGEWVALGRREWFESGMWRDDEHLGPYAPDGYCQRKLLDAFGVPKNSIVLESHFGQEATLANINRVPPDRLERIGEEEQAATFSLHFEVEEDEGTFAVDWAWEDSDSWEISRMDSGLEHGWMKLGLVSDLDIKHSSYQREIYFQARRALWEGFGISISASLLPNDKLFRMSPANLAKLGTKDPESHTLSDYRLASEVR